MYSMSYKNKIITTYDPERTIQPIYTGGHVLLDQQGRILATCLGEEALLTDLGTGELLARIEGVRNSDFAYHFVVLRF